MTVDLANIEGILRELISSPDVNNVVFKARPFMAMVKKDTDAQGDFFPQPVIYGSSQGRSATFTRAQSGAARTGSLNVKFQLTPVENYQLIQWSNIALLSSRGNPGAFITAKQAELKASMNNVSNDYSFDLFNNGSGSRGVIAAGGISGATITLATADDAKKFAVGMEIMLAAAETSGATLGLGTSGNGLYVTAVNRSTGVITFSSNVTDATNGIPAAAAGNYIFQRGDRNETGTYAAEKISGLLAWLPSSAPGGGDSFFGVNRSVDSALYGLSLNRTGYAVEEAILDAAKELSKIGGLADHAFMNPDTYNNLIKSLGARVRYCEVKIDGVSFGFRGIEIEGHGQTIKCFSDVSCPVGNIFVLQLDTWTLWSMGSVPRMLPYPGTGSTEGQIVISNADGIEMRLGGYAQLGCSAPGWNANVQI